MANIKRSCTLPRYYEVTSRILEALRERLAVPYCEWQELIKEIDLTLEYIRAKGVTLNEPAKLIE